MDANVRIRQANRGYSFVVAFKNFDRRYVMFQIMILCILCCDVYPIKRHKHIKRIAIP